MARIRSIKPEFWVSEQIAECSANARLTFVGLWNFCDDRGVHPAKPKTLKAELYPMDDITAAEVGRWVGELLAAGLVREFQAAEDGELYWHVTGWDRHQKIDRPSYKHPAPPPQDSASARRTMLGEVSPNARRAPPPGEDRRGEESKGGEEPASAKPRPAAKEAAQGTRLPADWRLPEEWRAYCRDKRPDLDPDDVAEGFRLYWVAQPGKDGRKADWLATWQTWVRKERAKPQAAGRTAPAVDPFEDAQ